MDTETLRFVRPVLQGDAGDSLDRLEYSHDGSRLAAATGNGKVLVWDTGTGAVLHRFVEGVRPGGSTSRPTTGRSTAPGAT